MVADPKLRPATEKDLESLFGLYRTVFQPHIEEIWGWDDSWQRTNFSKDFESSSTSVVEVHGDTAGFVQTVEEQERLVLKLIALSPETQGRGLGTALMENLKREAERRRIPLELVVFRTNDRACDFYERLGFRRTGRTDDFIEMSWFPV